jgi:ABC-2 type transport system ATP-binding protein
LAAFGRLSSRSVVRAKEDRRKLAVTNALAIEVRNLTKRYGRLVALDRLNLDVREGEVFAVLGRNGAGKTTLIEIMEGLRQPDEGEVKVLNIDPQRDLAVIKEHIGVQLQSASFFRKLRVLEIMRQFRAYYSHGANVEELLEMVALSEKRGSIIEDLSGGQRQRLALALALINDPKIVFLDEPTSGLDPQVRRQLWSTIKQMRDSGKTILLTTHYIEEAERLCDRVCIIDRGRPLTVDSPENLIGRDGMRANRVRLTTLLPFSFSTFPSTSLMESAENGRSTYLVQVPNTGQAIAEIITALASQGNELLEMQIVRRTLEDVFIDLTGKEIHQCQ